MGNIKYVTSGSTDFVNLNMPIIILSTVACSLQTECQQWHFSVIMLSHTNQQNQLIS